MFKTGKYGNLYIRPMPLLQKSGEIKGHTHYFDHVTLLSSGAIRCFRQDIHGVNLEVTEHFAPTTIEIPAKIYHKFVALEDNTQAFCIFALRDEDGIPCDSCDSPCRESYSALG